jgi:hypothetical protein
MQLEGITIFHIISSRKRPVSLPYSNAARKIQESLPYRRKKIIFAMTYESGREHVLDYRLYEQKSTSSLHHKGRSLDTIVGISQKDTLNKLLSNGMAKSALPLEFGGDLDIVSGFHQWIQFRLSVEDIFASACPIRNTTLSLTTTAETSPVTTVPDTETLFPQTSAIVAREHTISTTIPENTSTNTANKDILVHQRPGETQEEFKRRRNAFYVKRHHEQMYQKRVALRQESTRLKLANNALRQNIHRLENLLAQARLAVQAHAGETKACESHQ